MRKWFMKLRRNIQLKKNTAERKVTPLSEVESVGILINNEDFNLNKHIDGFVKNFTEKGIKVTAIVFLDSKVNRVYTFPYEALYMRDIGIFGNFKKEEIRKFIKTPFDYLYSLNYSPFLPFEYILASSKAKCRVGRFFSDRPETLEMMVDVKEEKGNLPGLLDQILHYQNKIASDEQ